MFHCTGFIRDLAARISNARTYLHEKIAFAQHAIYEHGRPLKGTTIETILKTESLVPTLNSFCERLSPLGFNLFSHLVVDLLHEFKLRVLKNILKHLL
ncbi:hypothetical protein J3R83DRAFT_4009 [Lanmaoa asiatica]|nr:hypothetical protein J3R83DRAFT_4009 [Lanmaoa asiatica]